MKIRIPNDKCCPEIDAWLNENVGYGKWIEWYNPLHNVPYRCFEIPDEQLATMFVLRWL
jgi:hypothetical protein